MESSGLNSKSKAYYEKQKVYEIFSRAEDYPKKVETFLKKTSKVKKYWMLDVEVENFCHR